MWWAWRTNDPGLVFKERKSCVSLSVITPLGEWANAGSSAIPGRPVAKVEQAPDTSPRVKNQFNIEAPGRGVSDIKLRRTDTTL